MAEKVIGPCEECGHDEGGDNVVYIEEVGAYLCRECSKVLDDAYVQEYWEKGVERGELD